MEKLVKRLNAKNVEGTGIKYIDSHSYRYKNVNIIHEYSTKYGNVNMRFDIPEYSGKYTVDEYKNSGLHEIVDKYCYRYDTFYISELIEDLEMYIKISAELAAKEDNIDNERVKETLRKEVLAVNNLLNDVRKIDLFSFKNEYEVTRIWSAYKGAERDMNILAEKIDKFDSLDRVDKQYVVDKIERVGYYYFSEDLENDYYVKLLKECVNK